MNDEDKRKLYTLKLSLQKGEIPTKKSIFWIIEKLEASQIETRESEKLLELEELENKKLKTRLANLKDDILEKIENIFDPL